MTQNFPDNTLYELDNLDVLRGMYSGPLTSSRPTHHAKSPSYAVAVNTLSGYSNIAIHSPQEAIYYDDEEDV